MIITLTKTPLSLFGIVRPKWTVDIFGGIALWCIGTVICLFVMSFVSSSMLARTVSTDIAHQPGPEGMLAYCLLLVSCIANAFAEELAMRGYLLTRLEQLLESRWMPILVSTALFASYHLYQGVPATIDIGVGGLIYAIAFCMFRRLWPLCLAHAITNFMIYM